MKEHKAVRNASENPPDLVLAEPSRFAQLVEGKREVLQNKITVSVEDKVVVIGYDVLMLDCLVKLILFFLLQCLCYDLYSDQSV